MKEAPHVPIPTTKPLFVVDPMSDVANEALPFRVVDVEHGQETTALTLEPTGPPDDEALASLSMSFGPWALHEAQPNRWPSHYADDLARKERIPAESFLAIDPLVSLSAAIAARTWVWSLACAGIALAICLFVPRGFCAYVCPLGSTIDLFDWAIGRRLRFLHLRHVGWWRHIRYVVLTATLVAALCGVLLSGFLAAIPILTRAMVYLVTPLQTAAQRGWHQVPPMTSGHWVSIGLFALVVGLGALRPRFWCRYLCPTGAVFSLGSLLRLTGRRVEPECIACGKCDAACSFDAVMSDFTTHPANCAFCQVCAGVCPTQAVSFRLRWTRQELSASEEPTGPKAPASTSPVPQAASVGRRGFLAAGLGVLAGCAGGSTTAAAIRATGAQTGAGATFLPVRPPGSLPEDLFLKMCVRCGECLQACPNDVLQPLQFEQGLEGLWTPHVVADWSGCEASCNNCGKVCPTGAIRDLPLDEKKVARMGLAVIDQKTCLPLAGREECRLCADECTRAGYNAIHFERVGTEVDEFGNPVEGSGFTAPVIQPEACVGCGLCQTRCRAINVVSKGLLAESAIVVEAGPGKEDRMVDGSYVTLREQERVEREKQRRERIEGDDGSYLPDFLQ